MEIRITTQQILNVLHILAWIIFIGLLFQAGSLIVYTICTLTLDPENIQKMWQVVELSNLHSFDPGYFIIETSLIITASVMEALLFYLIVKILHDKKLNMSQPFSKEIGRFIFNLSYLALGIGLTSNCAVGYAQWFVTQGVQMPDVQYLHIGGGDVWLFMSVILFVIAQIFKRGIEIQAENELTL